MGRRMEHGIRDGRADEHAKVHRPGVCHGYRGYQYQVYASSFDRLLDIWARELDSCQGRHQ